MKYIKNKGITLLEIIIIIAIIAIVSSIIFLNLSSFRNEQALKNSAGDIVTVLNKARQRTLSSVNSTNYGVHFDSDKMVLFTGSVYSPTSSSNENYDFSNVVYIKDLSDISIGGGRDVIFERLTGDTIGGSVTIRLLSNLSKYKTIIINKTGVVSIN